MNSEEIYTEYNSLFFDTYAFFEILRGNEEYKKYEKFKIVTTKLNLLELYFGLLKNVKEEKAEYYLKKYYSFVIEFNEEIIKDAAKLKNKLNKRNISMTDCIGYALAKQLGINFLTGDKEFETMGNVKFVK